MSKEFLPKGYETPKTEGKYMKLEQGDNTFRVLGSAIVGWEAWTPEPKPVRFKIDEKPTDLTPYKNEQVKHFWAFPVWNYAEERVQVLEITQVSIQKTIENYVADPDWGDPKEYDIVITRKGEGLDTEYSTRTKPHKPLTDEISAVWSKTTCDLEKLFTGEDPFSDAVDSDDEIDASDVV